MRSRVIQVEMSDEDFFKQTEPDLFAAAFDLLDSAYKVEDEVVASVYANTMAGLFEKLCSALKEDVGEGEGKKKRVRLLKVNARKEGNKTVLEFLVKEEEDWPGNG